MPGRPVDRANNLVHGWTSLPVYNVLNFAIPFIIFKCKYKYDSIQLVYYTDKYKIKQNKKYNQFD